MASISIGSRSKGSFRELSGAQISYGSGTASNPGTQSNQSQSQSQSHTNNINNIINNSSSHTIPMSDQPPINLYPQKTHQPLILRIKQSLPHPHPHPKSTFLARQHILSHIEQLHTENSTLHTCLHPPPITNELSTLQSQCMHLREQLNRLEKLEEALMASLGSLDNEERFMREQLNRNLGEIEGLQAEIRGLRDGDAADEGSVGSKMSSLMDKFIDYFEQVGEEGRAGHQGSHMDSNSSKNDHNGNFPKLQSLLNARKQLIAKSPNLQGKKSQIQSQPSALQLEYTQNIKQSTNIPIIVEQTQVQTHTNLASANVLPYDNENDMVVGAGGRRGKKMMKIKRLNTITFTGFEDDGDGGV